MDNSFYLLSLLKKIPKQYVLPLCIGCCGLILFISGLIQLFGNFAAQKTIVETKTIPETASVKSVKTIIVDVEGAVFQKGVYKIADASRIQDALIAAGGLAADADRNYVEQHINLAAKITDGAKIYIPRIGESALSTQTQISTQDTANTPININTAPLEVLDALEGIGPSRAKGIIDNRPYQDIQELVSKKVLGQKAFETIKEKISVY